jgi:DNA topoisomerase-1
MLSVDPIQYAKSVGLRYVSDDKPGIQRKQVGEEFVYVDVNGKKVFDAEVLDRIKKLVIPPAWREVWICPLKNGHLQSTGRDAKGRKQYRYHPEWCRIRNQTKFDRMTRFGLALPSIRKQTDHDLKLKGLCREKVLATVVQLLEKTFIRVGNAEYAEKNRSFGLTTLRNRHIEISGTKLLFRFRGKSGVEHEIELGDRRLAGIVKRCRDLPGYELFQYLDEEGKRQTVDSKDVNDYLQEITGEDFTAKDFRTWAGTVEAFLELKEIGHFNSQTEAKKNVVQAVKNVAKRLGNRPATCRKYYIHPVVLDTYMEGELPAIIEQSSAAEDSKNSDYELRPEEQTVLALLEQYACKN